jgi:hypothetical protein
MGISGGTFIFPSRNAIWETLIYCDIRATPTAEN